MPRTLFACSVLLALLGVSTLAQQLNTTTQSNPSIQTAPARDPQAVALVQTAFAALGGNRAPLTTVVASGTYTQFLAGSTVSYPLRVKVLGSDRFRWEIDTPDEGTVVTVVSGTASWSQSAAGTQAISVGEIPGKTFENFPTLALLTWAGTPSVGLKMNDTETMAGNTVYHISVSPTRSDIAATHAKEVYATTQQREIFLDQKTNLPIRLRYYSHPLDWRVPLLMEVEYSNFQSQGGIAFPSTVTTYLGDVKVSQIQYQSISLNVPVAATAFVRGGN